MTIKKNLLGFVVNFLVIQHTLFPASIDGTTSVKYLTENQVFRNGEYARGYVKLKSGATILSSCSALFNTQEPLEGGLDLRQTGALSLEGPIYFDSNFTLSGSGIIKGNGKIIFLNGNLTIPDNSIIHINSNTIIDGQGKNLIFGKRGRIFVDTNITLTLRNMKIVQTYNDFSDPCIRLAALKSNLTLDNVELSLFQDFLFPEGQLFVHGDVAVTGTSAFVYQSTQHTFIAPESTFYFDIGTTFSVVPATITDCGFDQWPTYSSSNFVVMTDATSRLCLNEASLCSTPTGSRFAKGTVEFENKCFIKSNSAIDLPSPYLVDTLQYVQTGNWPVCVDYSPTGSYVAVVNRTSNTLQIFDSVTLAQIGSDVITGNTPVYVSWSNTSTQIAVANSGDDTVKVYNFNGSSTPTLSASASTNSQPSCVAWSPYGKYIAVTNSGSNSLQVFKSDTLAQIGSNATTDSNPSVVSWAPGDRLLAVTNSTSDTLQLFSFDGVGTPTQIANHATDSTPSSVSWSQNGIFISVANKISNSTQIFAFDSTYSLNLIDTIPTDYTPTSISWSNDGRYLAFVNYTSNNLWYVPFVDQSLHTKIGSDVDTGQELTGLAWAPTEDYLAVISKWGSALQIYSFDGINSPVLVQASGSPSPTDIAWSPTGTFIAVSTDYNGNVYIYSFASGVLTYRNSYAISGVTPQSVSWSPSGDYFAVSASDSKLYIFSFNKISYALTLVGNTNTASSSINSVSWSAQEEFIALAGGTSGTLQIFSFTGSNPILVGSVSAGSTLESVSWAPTGDYLAVADSGFPSKLEIFSFNGSNPVLTNSIDAAQWVNSVSWSPDGRFITVSDRYAYILQTFSFSRNGDLIQVGDNVGTGSGSEPQVVAWSPQGKFVAEVNYWTKTLEVFSLTQASAKLDVSKKITTNVKPTSLSWSPNNTNIAVTSRDSNELQIFEVEYPSLLNQIGGGVTTGLRPTSVSWSPDSRFISLVNTYSSSIQVFSFNGNDSPMLIDTKTTLTGPSGAQGVWPTAAAWSPVGNFITITAEGNPVPFQGSSLQVFGFNGVDSLTRLVTKVFPSETPIGGLAWSPDGRFFAIDTYQSMMKVYSFNGIDNITQVGSDLILGVIYPGAISWSPDGRFISIAAPNLYLGNVFQIYSFDGVNTPTKVGNDVSTGTSPASATWSPDGRFIAVCNASSNELQIFSFNGTDTPVQVGGNATTEKGPFGAVWSPSGKFIALVNYYAKSIQLFSFDGANTPILVGTSSINNNSSSISWSPDEKFIAVAEDVSGTDGNLKIFKINLTADRTLQAISNGIVFGNSNIGATYDATVKLLAGASVNVDGLVNYDCVN